jgi:hypothetical protein
MSPSLNKAFGFGIVGLLGAFTLAYFCWRLGSHILTVDNRGGSTVAVACGRAPATELAPRTFRVLGTVFGNDLSCSVSTSTTIQTCQATLRVLDHLLVEIAADGSVHCGPFDD